MEEKERMKILSGENILINEQKSEFKIVETLEAIEIIDKYDYLKKAFKYILLNSKSNYSPYHDLNHLMTVMKYCYLGAIAEGVKDEKEVRELLIAAIFHDANHSAGKKTDDLNIKSSKKIMKEFVDSENIDVELGVMNDILDATQYPYEIKGEDLNDRQAIIRDADIMQIYQYNWIQQNIGGLAQELNIDFIDFLKTQKKFMDSVEFNTKWGKALKIDMWSDVENKFKILEDACAIKLKSEK